MKQKIFYQKIDSWQDASSPDAYHPALGLYPSDDFVVSRDRDGMPLSKYGDIAWNRTPYGSNKDGAWLYFDYWRARHSRPDVTISLTQLTPERDKRAREVRWLMFILIYLKRGNGLANSTIDRYCMLVCLLASFSETKMVAVADTLASTELAYEFCKAFPAQSTYFAALLEQLRKLGTEQTAINPLPKAVVSEIAKFSKNVRCTDRQTPPIPTRIYSYLLRALEEEITEFEQILPQLLGLLTACVRDRTYGRERTVRKRLNGPNNENARPNFGEALAEFGLSQFWISKGYKLTVQSLRAVIKEAMGICYLQIQAFSGMRFNEVYALPYFCLDSITANNEHHYLINGRVTKLTGGKIKRVQWVTSESGKRAIILAQKISGKIYELAGEFPEESSDRINSHHLFVTLNYAFEYFVVRSNKQPTLDLSSAAFDRIRNRICEVITEDDLRELEIIDPDRNWRDEQDFKIGNIWPLRTHQLRRSLALYAQASGLVSLPSLKRQLQHITRAMSQYYAKGGQFSKNFVDETEHVINGFSDEWRETAPESAYLGHRVNVEMADSRDLAGAYSLWYDRNVRRKQVSLDRDKTLKEFRQGKRAYRATFVGGCVKVGACDVKVTDPLNLNCLLNECQNQIIKISKFEGLIRMQVRTLGELEINAAELPETKIEKSILEAMQNKFQEILKAKARK